MDFVISILKDYLNSEIVLIIAVLGIIGLYRYFIQPRMDLLKKFEDDLYKKIEQLPSKEDLQRFSTDSHCAFSEKIIQKIEDICDKIESKLEKFENDNDLDDIKKELKEDIKDLGQIAAAFREEFLEHDGKADQLEIITTEIKQSFVTLYEVVDKVLLQLEEKKLIDKVDRLHFEHLEQVRISQNQLSTLAGLVAQSIKKSEHNTRLGMVIRNS